MGEPLPVALVDFATQQYRNLHGREEVGSDGQNAAVLRFGAGNADPRSAGARSDQGMVRQACGANARDGAELRSKIVVEGDNLGVAVSGLPGIQLERQHVFPVESESNGCQIRKRPHEQAGRDQNQKRDGDLRDHQNAAQAEAAKPVPARFAGPRFLERRHEVHPRRLKSRSEPEQHAGQQRERRPPQPARASSIPRAR